MAGNLYLIKRQTRPEWHKAPYHPVIVCDHKKIAQWQAGGTDRQAWVWSKENNAIAAGTGWLLERWNGFDIDYGGIVHSITMPDGSNAAFHHRHHNPETWALLDGATWWSTRRIPEWLVKEGVKPAEDDFTLECIRRDEWDYCPNRHRQEPAP